MTILSVRKSLIFYIFSVALCNFLCLPVHAQEKSGGESRYYYVGTLGDNLPVQLELVIDSGDISGSYMYDRVGSPIALTGEIDTKSSTITLVEQDEKGNKTGTFKGSIRGEGKNFGKVIEGEWSKANGLSSLAFKLIKVADLPTISVKKGDQYEASYMYPYFLADTKAFSEISARLEKEAAAERKKFVKEADEYFKTQKSAGGWQEDYSYSIEYYSPGLISLSGEVFSYTGGAHGNTYYISSNYWIKDGKALLLNLSDLFMPKSDFIKALSDYCINDLRKQNAGWVVDGELKELNAEDLKMFVVSTRGITFAFAPYAVAPYVEGPYFVTVGYGDLKGLINPKGPLKEFLK
jgi:Deacetylase PdaC/Protein of unknown function (DUF3298)